MKEFAIWYFDYGWIVAMGIGVWVGLTLPFKHVSGWTIFITAVGIACYIAKHGACL